MKPMIQAYRERHDFVYQALQGLHDVRVVPSDGTFYTFPDFRGVIANLEGIDDDIALATYLLDKAGIALVAGSGFGATGCLRISYAASMERLTEAMERLRQALVWHFA